MWTIVFPLMIFRIYLGDIFFSNAYFNFFFFFLLSVLFWFHHSMFTLRFAYSSIELLLLQCIRYLGTYMYSHI